MNHGTRLAMGAVAGLTALIPVYYLTEAAARALRAGVATFGPAPYGLAYLGAVAAIVTVLAAWPPAALCCGVPLASAGLLFALDLDAALGAAGRLPWAGSGGLPWARPDGVPWAQPGEPPGTLAGTTGLYLLIGALLVLSALPPVRVRSKLGG
ncbi:hypothetical protein FE391_19545 [Nonomuraea sp. KC401]|uniref:hypothetical protein n=1 Tax=unclassified Nonomuraea TaxID=2593643 RepID=UPI0010FE8879|nr:MULTISPECIES: hypothetical protein [unclassified Nonomuraea]NBE97663.1 hypothetical protein [Nonomuraea sp. K271]TLF71397.1 hypothetical protein FE391_19545 [Nonomuraea sp. KC401]